MRALFKQEDPNVLIIRDADWNEASLLIRYLDNIKDGAKIETKAAYNGNQEVNGIVFTIDTKKPEPAGDTFIKVNAEVTNDDMDLPVFRIQLSTESENYNPFKIDESRWADFKEVLETLGITDLSITTQGDIVGANTTGAVISGTIVIPKGLVRYVDTVTGLTNVYSDSLSITLE